MNGVTRLPIVGVMGSGSCGYTDLAAPLGRLLAQLEVHLLTGGGQGAMATVSQAFAQSQPRRGMVIGILPCDDSGSEPKPGYPNPWVELSIRTHLPLSGTAGTDPMSRNHINILTSDVVVALPGEAGTVSEITLAKAYCKPLAAFGWNSAGKRAPSNTISLESLEEVERFLAESIAIRSSAAQ